MNRQQLCDEWHIPYFATEEECNEEDNRGDFEYHTDKELGTWVIGATASGLLKASPKS